MRNIWKHSDENLHIYMFSAKSKPEAMQIHVHLKFSKWIKTIIYIQENTFANGRHFSRSQCVNEKYGLVLWSLTKLKQVIISKIHSSHMNTCSIRLKRISSAGTRIFWNNEDNTKAADGLAPCISRPSATMAVTMQISMRKDFNYL